LFKYKGDVISNKYLINTPKLIVINNNPIFDGNKSRKKKNPISMIWIKESKGNFKEILERIQGKTGLKQGAKISNRTN